MQELQPAKATAEIPSAFYTHVLSGSAALTPPLRFWSLVHMILQQSLGQLDPRRIGLALRLVCCMSPDGEGKVRSLRTSIGLGTPPWNMQMQPRLLGAESLAGQALLSRRLMVVEGCTDQEFITVPGYSRDSGIVACPIERASRICGCLLAYGVYADYFNQARLALIRHYANLLTMAFESSEFYDVRQLNLCVMPSWEIQAQSFTTFHRRVADVLTTLMRSEQLVDIKQAELQVWRQFEEEFCCKSYSKTG